jgi:hypothetical protein
VVLRYWDENLHSLGNIILLVPGWKSDSGGRVLGGSTPRAWRGPMVHGGILSPNGEHLIRGQPATPFYQDEPYPAAVVAVAGAGVMARVQVFGVLLAVSPGGGSW